MCTGVTVVEENGGRGGEVIKRNVGFSRKPPGFTPHVVNPFRKPFLSLAAFKNSFKFTCAVMWGLRACLRARVYTLLQLYYS